MRGVTFFVSGEEAEQIAIGQGAEGFGAVAIVAQAGGGKDGRSLQTAERSEGGAISTVELAQVFEKFGFEMGVGAAALRSGTPARAVFACRGCGCTE